MSVVKRTGLWLRSNPFRTYAVAIVLAVLPLTVFVVAAHKLFLRQVVSQTVARSSQQGTVIGLIIEQHLNEQRVFLESLAKRPDLVHDWENKNYAHLSATLQDLHSLRGDLLGFGVCDTDGTLRVAAPPPNPSAIGQNFASRPWYGPVKQTWKPYISPVFQSPRPGNPWVVAIAVPVFADGKPVAILISAQTLDEVTKPVYSLLPGENVNNVAFIDQRGQAFGMASANAAVSPLNLDQEMVSALQKDRPGSGRLLKIGGVAHIGEYSPIPSLGWGVLIQAPESSITNAVWIYEKNLALLAGFLALLAFGGGAIVAYLYKRLRDTEHRYFGQLEAQNRQLELRNREVERATEVKTRFLATMSHELRTPLNAVLGFATLLTEEPALGAKQRRWAEHIREGGKHLLQLVNDVLDLSKIEAGRLELQRETFSVGTTVPEVVSTLSPLVQAKRIKVASDVEGGLYVFGDRMRFKQILYNLLSNALKFTPAGGDVRVRASRQEDSALIEVEDNGVGIEPADQRRIFEEFSQLSSSDGNSLGTGLGLAITKRLVEQHGGRLWVRSEPNRGSCFAFLMPLGEPEPAQAAETTGQQSTQRSASS